LYAMLDNQCGVILFDGDAYAVDIGSEGSVASATVTPMNMSRNRAIRFRQAMARLFGRKPITTRADIIKWMLQEAARLRALPPPPGDGNRTGLGSVDLDGENLTRADLRDQDLCRQDLRGRDFKNASFIGADLRGADLRGADLRGADLRGADLRRADLSGADLRGADLRRADLSGADLSGADLRDANLRDANLSGANLCGALAE